MTHELEELDEINPVRAHQLIGAVAIDRETLFETFEADDADHRRGLVGRVRTLRSTPSTSASRVGYVGAGLLVAASFLAVALVGAGRIAREDVVSDPADTPEADVLPEQPPVIAVPAEEESPDARDTGSVAVGSPEGEPAQLDDSSGGEACSATGETKALAVEAFETACDAERVDCDPISGLWVCAADTLGTNAPATGEQPAIVRPVIDGPFDPEKDLLSLHYGTPSIDDHLAALAAREIATWLSIEPHVVVLTRSVPIDPKSKAVDVGLVVDAGWGESNWLSAENPDTVDETAERWLATIDSGGSVWVADAAVSDFTAQVVREVERLRPELPLSEIVHVVQHSNGNHNSTDAEDLAYLGSTIDYVRIEDGNEPNKTADLNAPSPEFMEAALAGRYAEAWRFAFEMLDPTKTVDFSDTVEVLHIIGVGVDDVADPAGFAAYFMS